MVEPSIPGTAPGSLAGWDDLDLCCRVERPGHGIDHEPAVNFARSRTSRDQLEIEQYLERQKHRLGDARLLHVGVGNSSLALRLHLRCLAIDGLTMAPEEKTRAESLRLLNYTVLLLNKYGLEFARRLRPGYAWIVDNNPASFACCRYHYARMLENYRWALAPGGRILTHRRGLDWVALDRRWHLTFDDLAASASRFGLRAVKLEDDLIALDPI